MSFLRSFAQRPLSHDGHVVAERHRDRLRPAVDAELLQDVLDVRADGLRLDRQAAGDLVLRQTLGEQTQDLGLSSCECRAHRGAQRASPKLQAPHPREQLVGRIRLDHVVVRADQQTGNTVIRFRPLSGEEHHGYPGPVLELQGATDLVAREHRQRYLENRDAWVYFAGYGDGLISARGLLDLVAGGQENARELVARFSVGVRNQYGCPQDPPPSSTPVRGRYRSCSILPAFCG